MRLSILAALLITLSMPGRADITNLEPGAMAPDFEFRVSEDEKPRRLSDYRGKSVLLAFYPRAFSKGCTRQLSEYRDEFDHFITHDTEIIAVSGDSQELNDQFKKANNYPFTMVGDPEQKIVNLYGVPTRSWLGRNYAQRAIFLIDKKGAIQYVELDYHVSKSKQLMYDQVRELFDESQPKTDSLRR